MPFIFDKEDPSKFSHVKCSKSGLRFLIHRCKTMGKEKAPSFLLSRLISLVFSREDLALAQGLGLRSNNGLDSTKVDAIYGKSSNVFCNFLFIFSSITQLEFNAHINNCLYTELNICLNVFFRIL